MPRSAVALRSRFQNCMVVAWYGRGIACESNTAALWISHIYLQPSYTHHKFYQNITWREAQFPKLPPLCSFLQPSSTSSILGPNIFLKTQPATKCWKITQTHNMALTGQACCLTRKPLYRCQLFTYYFMAVMSVCLVFQFYCTMSFIASPCA
jgi:hypothetical protein